MTNIEDKIRFNGLLNVYKDILSLSQHEILEDYFEYDLSITEIAENRNISRAAVEDALKKGTLKLESLETSLHVYEMKSNLQALISKNKEKSMQNSDILNEIERIIK